MLQLIIPNTFQKNYNVYAPKISKIPRNSITTYHSLIRLPLIRERLLLHTLHIISNSLAHTLANISKNA